MHTRTRFSRSFVVLQCVTVLASTVATVRCAVPTGTVRLSIPSARAVRVRLCVSYCVRMSVLFVRVSVKVQHS